jgi:hypothetical protein
MQPSIIPAGFSILVAGAALAHQGDVTGFIAGCVFCGLVTAWWRLRKSEADDAEWRALRQPHYDNEAGRLETQDEAELRFIKAREEFDQAKSVLTRHKDSSSFPRDARFIV